jgi:ABC-type multidrug transport system fused ATPase/permease subunit
MVRWEKAGDEAAVREAAARSGTHSFVEDLPHGYDTLLGPQFFGGSDLSGGQWQRVALARAFFRDAEVVILEGPPRLSTRAPKPPYSRLCGDCSQGGR